MKTVENLIVFISWFLNGASIRKFKSLSMSICYGHLPISQDVMLTIVSEEQIFYQKALDNSPETNQGLSTFLPNFSHQL